MSRPKTFSGFLLFLGVALVLTQEVWHYWQWRDANPEPLHVMAEGYVGMKLWMFFNKTFVIYIWVRVLAYLGRGIWNWAAQRVGEPVPAARVVSTPFLSILCGLPLLLTCTFPVLASLNSLAHATDFMNDSWLITIVLLTWILFNIGLTVPKRRDEILTWLRWMWWRRDAFFSRQKPA